MMERRGGGGEGDCCPSIILRKEGRGKYSYARKEKRQEMNNVACS